MRSANLRISRAERFTRTLEPGRSTEVNEKSTLIVSIQRALSKDHAVFPACYQRSMKVRLKWPFLFRFFRWEFTAEIARPAATATRAAAPVRARSCFCLFGLFTLSPFPWLSIDPIASSISRSPNGKCGGNFLACERQVKWTLLRARDNSDIYFWPLKIKFKYFYFQNISITRIELIWDKMS